MRFVVTGEWSKNQLLRLIMVMFLGFVACFWLVTTLLFVEKMGFSAAGVAQYFLGDPELEFGQPARSYGSMLETSHMHLFAMGMLVMVLTHLLLFAPIPVPVKFWSVLATFGFTFMNEAANWMVRYFGASWAWVKLFFFVAMQASFIALMVVLVAYTIKPSRNAYKDSASPTAHP